MKEAFNLQNIPKIDKLLKEEKLKKLASAYNCDLLHNALKNFLSLYRKNLLALQSQNQDDATNEIVEKFYKFWHDLVSVNLKKVFNATGSILHTNLGRAPFPYIVKDVFESLVESYVNLEIDEKTLKRTKRERFVLEKIKFLTGAEYGVFVNNNSASLYLLLKTIAENKEVIVSRGELVEIGEGFRLPAIMKETGAKVIEVGTTNRTYLEDYKEAINEHTALILKIHQSNFYQRGFVKEVSINDLSLLTKKYNIPLAYDLGSGFLYNLNEVTIIEPNVRDAIRDGADIVMFSGDKLLGGPQAGIMVGNKNILEKVRNHPLYRTYRLDKITLLFLETVLSIYFLKEEEILKLLPHFKLLSEDNKCYIEKLTPSLVNLPHFIKYDFVKKTIKLGGGSAPSYKKKVMFLKLQTEADNIGNLLNMLAEFKHKIFYKIKNGVIYLHINYLNFEVIKNLIEFLCKSGK